MHKPKSGQDLEMQQAAPSVLRYFIIAALQHHANEEHDLLTMLQSTVEGEDANPLNSLLPGIVSEHRHMDAAWIELDQQLQKIAYGASFDLSEANVARYAEVYAAHTEKEETQIALMAKRLYSTA